MGDSVRSLKRRGRRAGLRDPIAAVRGECDIRTIRRVESRAGNNQLRNAKSSRVNLNKEHQYAQLRNQKFGLGWMK